MRPVGPEHRPVPPKQNPPEEVSTTTPTSARASGKGGLDGRDPPDTDTSRDVLSESPAESASGDRLRSPGPRRESTPAPDVPNAPDVRAGRVVGTATPAPAGAPAAGVGTTTGPAGAGPSPPTAPWDVPLRSLATGLNERFREARSHLLIQGRAIKTLEIRLLHLDKRLQAAEARAERAERLAGEAVQSSELSDQLRAAVEHQAHGDRAPLRRPVAAERQTPADRAEHQQRAGAERQAYPDHVEIQQRAAERRVHAHRADLQQRAATERQAHANRAELQQGPSGEAARYAAVIEELAEAQRQAAAANQRHVRWLREDTAGGLRSAPAAPLSRQPVNAGPAASPRSHTPPAPVRITPQHSAETPNIQAPMSAAQVARQDRAQKLRNKRARAETSQSR